MRSRFLQPLPVPAPEADASLVGSWCSPGARSALVDASSGGNDLSINGTVRLGQHNPFIGDGASGYLRKAVANFRSSDSAGTVEAWINPTGSAAAYKWVFASCDEASAIRYLCVGLLNDSTNRLVIAQHDGTTGNTVRGGTTIPTNQWTHVVLASTGLAYVGYVNGVAETMTVVSGANDGGWLSDTPNRDNISIAMAQASGGVAGYFPGEIRGVNVYSEAKSADWVKTRFQRGVPDSTVVLDVNGDGRDLSRYRRTATISGGPILGRRIYLDGTDDKLAYGDCGNIQEVSFWVNPGSTSEQLFRADTGKSVSIVAGTITYTGLTATATYVNGVAGTTLAASRWQHVVCQFQTTDANNLDIGWDGTNYGDIDVDGFAARTTARSAAAVVIEHRHERVDY